jgi:hypothetical protein
MTRDGPRAALLAAAWSLAGAACAGGAWAGTLVLTRALFNQHLGRELESDLATSSFTFGLICAWYGVVVGILAGIVMGRHDRAKRISLLALGGFLTGAVGGGLTPRAVHMGTGVMSPLASSSLVWALAGALAGLVARAVSGRVKRPPGPEDEEPVEAAHPVATTRRPRARRLRTSLWALVGHSPLLAASAAALVAAAVVAPSESAVTPLVVGVMGASTASSLINLDRRLRAQERRTGT